MVAHSGGTAASPGEEEGGQKWRAGPGLKANGWISPKWWALETVNLCILIEILVWKVWETFSAFYAKPALLRHARNSQLLVVFRPKKASLSCTCDVSQCVCDVCHVHKWHISQLSFPQKRKVCSEDRQIKTNSRMNPGGLLLCRWEMDEFQHVSRLDWPQKLQPAFSRMDCNNGWPSPKRRSDFWSFGKDNDVIHVD